MATSRLRHKLARAQAVDTDPVTERMSAWTPSSPEPPEPHKLRMRITEGPRELEMQRRTGNFGISIFLTIWMTIWTAGCIALVGQAIKQPTTQHLLFAVPFVVSWLGVGALYFVNLFGRERLSISRNGIDYEWRAMVTLKGRHVDLEEVKSVTGFSTEPDSESGHHEHGVKVLTTGEPLRFGKGLGDEQLVWLADRVARQIHALAPAALEAQVRQAAAPDAGAETVPRVETLQPSHPPVEPPTSSNLRVDRDFNRTAITWRPRVRSVVGSFLGITFVMLFWNGIISVFLFELVKNWSWFGGCFMVPFVIIGVAMILGWLATLFSPFRRKQWIFTPGEITTRTTVLGVGRTSHVELRRLARLELRQEPPKAKAFRRTNEDPMIDGLHTLALVDTAGTDLLTLPGLTEGEARWAGDELLRDFRQWHVRVSP